MNQLFAHNYHVRDVSLFNGGGGGGGEGLPIF